MVAAKDPGLAMDPLTSDDEEENKTPENVEVTESTEAAVAEAKKNSWKKTTLVAGDGDKATDDAYATVHIVGYAIGAPMPCQDTRAYGVPRVLELREATPYGLREALLTMRVGEKAEVRVEPAGGYGAEGRERAPKVPSNATLRYEVELLELQPAPPLTSEAQLALASESRLRGNNLFNAGNFEWADLEYSDAGDRLAKMAALGQHETPEWEAMVCATNLNLAASRIKLEEGRQALEYANAVLELRPDDSKALFRCGQANALLGEYATAKEQLKSAEEAAKAQGDETRVKAIGQERARLAQRVQKQKADQKAAYAKMVHHEGKVPEPLPPVKEAVANLSRGNVPALQQVVAYFNIAREEFNIFHQKRPHMAKTGIPAGLLLLGLGIARLVTAQALPPMMTMVTTGSIMFLYNLIVRAGRWVRTVGQAKAPLCAACNLLLMPVRLRVARRPRLVCMITISRGRKDTIRRRTRGMRRTVTKSTGRSGRRRKGASMTTPSVRNRSSISR